VHTFKEKIMLHLIQVVVDTVVSAPTDSVAVEVGSQIGAYLGTLLVLGLGFVNKVVVDLAKKGLALLDTAPSVVKSLVALLFAFAATWVSSQTGFNVSPEVGALPTTLSAVLVWAVSMGWHSLSKVISGLFSK
jgi:hypothetical protein